jgi:hypothetical protein
VLFTDAGILQMLEGYTYDEEWPLEEGLKLTSSTGDSREMDKIRMILHP